MNADEVRQICEAIVSNLGFYPHHIGSYENFLSNLVPKMVAEHSPIRHFDSKKHTMHVVHMINVRYRRPYIETSPGNVRPSTGKALHKEKLSLTTDVIVDLVQEKYVRKGSDQSGKTLVLSERLTYKDFCLMELPLMDGTKLCNDYDIIDPVARERYAGTYCINGHRKCMIVQTRICNNFPFVKETNRNSRSTYSSEIRSEHKVKMRSTSTMKLFLSGGQEGGSFSEFKILCQIPYIAKKIPLTVLLSILGLKTHLSMMEAICPKFSQIATNRNSSSTISAYSMAFEVLTQCPGLKILKTRTTEEALLSWVATEMEGAKVTGSHTTETSRSVEAHARSMRNLFSSEVLPHLGDVWDDHVLKTKAMFIGHAVRKLLLVANKEQPADDTDEIIYQRFSTSGRVLAMKLRQLLRQAVAMAKATMVRCCENGKRFAAIEILNSNTVSRPLRSCMARGNFACSRSQNSSQNGVCQVLNSMNRLSRVGHMTVINKPVSRDGSHSDPRQLKTSAWGVLCAAHTPDGRSIGLVTHHTLFFDISRGHSVEHLIELVLALDVMHPIILSARSRLTKRLSTVVNVNSQAIGRTSNVSLLMEKLRKMKMNFILPKDISFSYDSLVDVVTVHSEEGDGNRPILVAGEMMTTAKALVERYGKYMPHLLYSRLLTEGALVYVNKTEESLHCLVAHTHDQLAQVVSAEHGPLFTHAEIDPSVAMFGATVGLIPFSQCNQGPRNVYFGAMAPQAIGAEHPMSQQYHIDMLYHTLMYPQRPLTRTLTSTLVEGDDCAESIYQIFNVAIIPSMGKNEEDAIVVNRTSVERGLGVSTKYSVIRESEAELASGDKECFMAPPDEDENGRPVVGRRNASYAAVDPKSGLPIKGMKVKPGDVIIGKVLKVRLYGKNASFVTRLIDKSTVWSGNCDALIDSVASFKRSGTMHVMVRVAEIHFLQTGDKMSSVSAQKGVVADMVSQEDMPFTHEGITPDMLFSPHGITSRMTIGGVREFVSNYLATKSGKVFDGTAFRVENISLIDGVARSGACEHSFISGITGKPIGRGFMFLAGYTLQRHQVSSKVHARSSGPRNAITQQPSEGRSHKGGLKLGSMEISCLASTGAAHALRDCMTDFDGKYVQVCNLCGRLAETSCVACNGREGSKVVRAFIPRITLVLMWELAACGVSMRLIPE